MERRGQPAQRDSRLRRASSNSIESISAQQLHREHREHSASHKRSSGSISSDRISLRDSSQEPTTLDYASLTGRGKESLAPRSSKPLIRPEDIESFSSDGSSSRRIMSNVEGSSSRLVRTASKISDGGRRDKNVVDLDTQNKDQREFIDKIQSTVSCSICVQLLHEPFTTSCGHTFCYGCLNQWFEQNKTCPECRGPVVSQPAPAYIVRDIVAALISKPGLLSSKESLKEHLEHRKEASEQLEQDKAKDELFRGYFKYNNDRRQVIQDEADGVERCPFDGFEIEDGVCTGCNRTLGLDGFMYDSEFGDMDDDMLDHPLGLWTGDGHIIDLDAEEDEEDDEDYDDEDFDAHFGNIREHPIIGMARRAAHSAAAGRARREQTVSTFDSEMMTVDEEEEEDDDDDETSGSMDGFIVRDEEASPDGSEETSSEEEDGDASMDDTTRFDNQPDTSDSEPPVSRSRGRGGNSRAPIIIPSDDEDEDDDDDDDDEGGAISNGRRRRGNERGAVAQGYLPLDHENVDDASQQRRSRRAEGSVTPTQDHPTPSRPSSRTGRTFTTTMRRGTARSGRGTPQRFTVDDDGDVDMQTGNQSRNPNNRPRLNNNQSNRNRQNRPARYNPDLEQMLAQHATQLSSYNNEQQAWNMLDGSRTPSQSAYTIMRPRTANRRRSFRNLSGQSTIGQQSSNALPGHQRHDSMESSASQSSASAYGIPSFPVSHGLSARANLRTPNLRSPPHVVAGLATPETSAPSVGPISPTRPASRQRMAPSPVQSPTSFWGSASYAPPATDRNPWASQRTHTRLARQASNNGLRSSHSRRDLRSQTPSQQHNSQQSSIRHSPSSQRLRSQGSNARLRASTSTPNRQVAGSAPSIPSSRPLRASNPWYNMRNSNIDESNNRAPGEGSSETLYPSGVSQGHPQNLQLRSPASPVLRKRHSNRSMGIHRNAASSPSVMVVNPSWTQRSNNYAPGSSTSGSNINFQFLFPSNRLNASTLMAGGAETRQ